jgi:hypothetical protein
VQWKSGILRSVVRCTITSTHADAEWRQKLTECCHRIPAGDFMAADFQQYSPHSLRSQAFRTGRVWGCGRGGGFRQRHPFRVGKTGRVNFYLVISVYLILFYNLLVIDLFGKIKSGFSLFIDLFQILQVCLMARIPSINLN